MASPLEVLPQPWREINFDTDPRSGDTLHRFPSLRHIEDGPYLCDDELRVTIQQLRRLLHRRFLPVSAAGSLILHTAVQPTNGCHPATSRPIISDPPDGSEFRSRVEREIGLFLSCVEYTSHGF